MNYWKISFGCLAGLVLAAASCGHPGGGGGGSGGNSGSGGSGNCTPGMLGCACNGTSCNDGLSCATDINQCVSTGSGSGGATGSAGATGSGGAVSSGGNTGTGGSATGGAAGGASTGSGGAVSTGGTTGSGGAAGASATGGNTGSGGSSGGTNLVANGDFSQSDTNWHFENGTAAVNNGQYCESSTGSNALFGWQNMATPLMLSGSQMYTLSYKASGSGNAVIHVKVAHAVSPYTPDDYESSPDDMLTGSLQTFTHAFKPGAGDDSNTGIAFFVMAGQNICISSVSLVAN